MVMVALSIILTSNLLIPITKNVKSVDNKHVYIPELSLLRIQTLFMLL